nr:3-phenylpropionate MFS transporter [uncultured Kingella sp.]
MKPPIQIPAFSWLALNFFGYFCAFGVIQPFFPLWLQSHHYSELFIAVVMSSAYLFRFLGGLLLSKRVGQLALLLPTIRLATWASVLALLSAAASVGWAWLLVVLVWLFFAFNGGEMLLNETAASAWQKQIGLDYGRARLCGSGAYIFGALLSGWVVAQFGAEQLIYLMVVLLLVHGVMQLPQAVPALHNRAVASQEASLGYMALLRQPETRGMLLAVSLIQGSHAAYYTYGVIYWQSAGLAPQQISWLWSVAVVAEIVLFFFSRRLLGGVEIVRLMQISALLTMGRWLLMAATVNPWLLLAVQMMHAAGFSLSHFTMVRFIVGQPEKDMAKLQALYIGLASCVVVAVLTLLAGGLYKLQPSWAFAAMSVFAFAVLWLLPRRAG